MRLRNAEANLATTSVPESLRAFLRHGVLDIASNGPHYEVLYVAPICAVITLLGVAAVSGMSGVSLPLALIVGVAAIAFGSVFLFECLYSWRGNVEVAWRGGSWVITKRLWRWSRAHTIPASQIRHVEVVRPSPGEFGPYVRVHMQRTERTSAVGHSLCLPDAVLEGLRELLDPKH